MKISPIDPYPSDPAVLRCPANTLQTRVFIIVLSETSLVGTILRTGSQSQVADLVIQCIDILMIDLNPGWWPFIFAECPYDIRSHDVHTIDKHSVPVTVFLV
jgi:hypothetical protein